MSIVVTTAIWQNKYQLCAPCANKWRYYQETCDACGKVCQANEAFHIKENKMLCNGCHKVWSRKCKGWLWERFLEYREAWVERPPTFNDTELIAVPKADRVRTRTEAECQSCGEFRRITNSTYQLCSTCIFIMSSSFIYGNRLFMINNLEVDLYIDLYIFFLI